VHPATIWTIALHTMLIAALVSVVLATRQVISWILVAVFLALSLDPAVRLLQRRLPRAAAVLIVVLSIGGLVALLLGTLVPLLIEQGKSLLEAAPGWLERLRNTRLVAELDSRVGLVARAQQELAGEVGNAAGPLFRVLGSLVRAAGATVTTAVLTCFMLLFGGALFRSLLGWLPSDRRARTVELVGRVHRAVGGYVSGTLLIALIGGVVTTLALLLLGVPYFLPLGLAMMVLGVVPFLGAALGGLLIVTTTFLSAGVRSGLIALVVFLLYQQVENHLLQPLVQRHTIQMNPLAIALVMLIGTAFAGILGALLALPLAAATQIVLADLRDRSPANDASPAIKTTD
jgi:predicted PurR-regulated permease PerM